MSGRQAKLTRREIRRASETSVKLMQEQQENAIQAVLERCTQIAYAHQLLTAKLHNLDQRIGALEPVATAVPAPVDSPALPALAPELITAVLAEEEAGR